MNDKMLSIVVILFWQQDFFAVWLQIFWIYQDCFKAMMKIFIVVIVFFFLFSKTIVVKLAENMCDSNTIMINVPLILCRRHFLLSELHQSGTHIYLVVHIGDVWL